MHHRVPFQLRAGKRRGSGTLELVMVLPLLLFVMALAINFGIAASWKIRSLVAARDAAWRSRAGHSTDYPHPTGWPRSAGMGVSGGGRLDALDEPLLDHPVVRGPMPGGTEVRSDLLDPTRGLRAGYSAISRKLAYLQKLGDYSFRPRQTILNGTWTYSEMGLERNHERRIPVLYALPQESDELVERYIDAVKAIFFAPFRRQLRPLDRDEEIRFYREAAADFHPRVAGFCEIDTALVHDQFVLPLVDRIQGSKNPVKIGGVPETMTRYFIDMYREAIENYHELLDAYPSPTPAETNFYHAEINNLQAKIRQLESFLVNL